MRIETLTDEELANRLHPYECDQPTVAEFAQAAVETPGYIKAYFSLKTEQEGRQGKLSRFVVYGDTGDRAAELVPAEEYRALGN